MENVLIFAKSKFSIFFYSGFQLALSFLCHFHYFAVEMLTELFLILSHCVSTLLRNINKIVDIIYGQHLQCTHTDVECCFE